MIKAHTARVANVLVLVAARWSVTAECAVSLGIRIAARDRAVGGAAGLVLAVATEEVSRVTCIMAECNVFAMWRYRLMMNVDRVKHL